MRVVDDLVQRDGLFENTRCGGVGLVARVVKSSCAWRSRGGADRSVGLGPAAGLLCPAAAELLDELWKRRSCRTDSAPIPLPINLTRIWSMVSGVAPKVANFPGTSLTQHVPSEDLEH